jgi:hypothetical protein
LPRGGQCLRKGLRRCDARRQELGHRDRDIGPRNGRVDHRRRALPGGGRPLKPQKREGDGNGV